MFTGIVNATGQVLTLSPHQSDLRIQIEAGHLDLSQVKLGDSIATNGVCLTVTELGATYFWADVSGETLRHSTLGTLKRGESVNLETALTLATPLGGHLVSGHVDGVGELIRIAPEGRAKRLYIKAPSELCRYIAKKGSICLDGISLTVNEVQDQIFELTIVPHTQTHTTLAQWLPGRKINIEVDIMARYLERLLQGTAPVQSSTSRLDTAFLATHGFMK